MEKGYPDTLQVILMDLFSVRILKWLSKEHHVGLWRHACAAVSGASGLRVAQAGLRTKLSSLRMTLLLAVLVPWGVQEAGSLG